MVGDNMVLQCERCGKGVMRGHNVSHAKNRTKRVFKPNLQTLRVLQGDGTRKKMKMCSKCVRIVRREEKSRLEQQAKSKKKAMKDNGENKTTSIKKSAKKK